MEKQRFCQASKAAKALFFCLWKQPKERPICASQVSLPCGQLTWQEATSAIRLNWRARLREDNRIPGFLFEAVKCDIGLEEEIPSPAARCRDAIADPL